MLRPTQYCEQGIAHRPAAALAPARCARVHCSPKMEGKSVSTVTWPAASTGGGGARKGWVGASRSTPAFMPQPPAEVVLLQKRCRLYRYLKDGPRSQGGAYGRTGSTHRQSQLKCRFHCRR